MRRLLAFAFVTLAACGEGNRAPQPPPAPPVEAPPPPHPSGASDEDVAWLRWLQTAGAPLHDAVNDACNPLDQCANLLRPGEMHAPTHPSLIAGCIAERRAACQRAHDALAAAQVPAPFVRGFDASRAQAASSLCYADARARLLAEHPEVVHRLRPASHGMVPAARRHYARGWESLESWAADQRTPWARAFRDETTTCPTFDVSGYPSITAWLRQRFFCGPAGGCCTLERVARLHREGLEPGPADPTCGGATTPN